MSREIGLRIKGLASVLLYFGINYALIFILAIIIYLVTPASDLTNEEFTVKYGALLTMIPLIVILIVLAIVNFKELKTIVANQLVKGKTYLHSLYIFLSYFIAVYVLGMFAIFLPNLEETDNQEAINTMLNGDGRIMMVISVALLAPIVEELVFRYSLINFLESFKFLSKLKVLPYIISALIFTVIHETNIFFNFSLENAFNFLLYLVPALVLSIGYMRTNKNIVAVIITHILINILSLLASLLV